MQNNNYKQAKLEMLVHSKVATATKVKMLSIMEQCFN